MALVDSTTFHHGSTPVYLSLHYSTMALFDSTFTLPWLYFTLLDSILLLHGCSSVYFTIFYHGSTSLHLTPYYFTIVVLHSTAFYHSSTSLYILLYFILHYSTMTLTLLPCAIAVLDSTILYYCSSSFYLILHYYLYVLNNHYQSTALLYYT